MLKAGDRLTTSDTQANLREFSRLLGGTLFSGDQAVDAEHPLSAEGQQIAEVVITPGFEAERCSYRQRQAALTVMDCGCLPSTASKDRRRESPPGWMKSSCVPVTCCWCSRRVENLRELKETADFLVLDGSIQLPSTKKAPIALATMLGVVALAALNIMPIEISAILGFMVLIVTRCLNWKDAMSALSTQVILIIVSSLAMGAALLKTGGADYLAKLFVYITFGAPPSDGAGRADADDGHPDQYRLEQRGRGDRHARSRSESRSDWECRWNRSCWPSCSAPTSASSRRWPTRPISC